MTDTTETLRAFAKRRRKVAAEYRSEIERLQTQIRFLEGRKQAAIEAADSCERMADDLENIGATG